MARTATVKKKLPAPRPQAKRPAAQPVLVPKAMRTAYLDLLEKALTGLLYQDRALGFTMGSTKPLWKRVRNKLLGKAPKNFGGAPVYDDKARLMGRDWPSIAPTMIGVKRMQNLRMICEDVVCKSIPGDFIETGVWRGGACIYARAIFNAFGEAQRNVWVADSFEGLPPPNPELYPADKGDKHHTFNDLAISKEQVEENFKRYSVMGSNVKFLKGWFKDTLPKAAIKQLAILRLDGDMYESTMDGLKVYDKVSVGGYVIVDDYGAVPACKRAIEDFRKARGIKDPIINIDGIGVYWQKTRK